VSSCRKKDIDVPFEDLEGDYEWFYSDSGAAFDVSEDQYGIRITGNGRVKTFMNGELIENYRILETGEISNGISSYVFIYADDKDDPFRYSIANDTLRTWRYPYDGYTNYYVKTK
jgi:hypothetical protein